MCGQDFRVFHYLIIYELLRAVVVRPNLEDLDTIAHVSGSMLRFLATYALFDASMSAN